MYNVSMENGLVPWLRDQLDARSWTHNELARRAGVSQPAVSSVVSRQRRAGWDFCLAIAEAFDEPPEKVMRLAGLLPPLPPPFEDEQEAVQILREMPYDVRLIVMKILRALKSEPDSQLTSDLLERYGPEPEPEPEPEPDPYLQALAELWDQAPDWLKKSFTAQLRITVEEYEREQEKWSSAPPDEEAGVDSGTVRPES
jgi:transcriptional regulator with XRE-family HTH domain